MPLYQDLLFYSLSWKSRQPADQGAGLTKGSVSSSHFDLMDKAGYLDHTCNHRLATLRYCFQCQPINSTPYVQSEQRGVVVSSIKHRKAISLKESEKIRLAVETSS
jgi:hypothetical protein